MDLYQEMVLTDGQNMTSTKFGEQMAKNLDPRSHSRRNNPRYYSFDKVDGTFRFSPGKKSGSVSNFGKFQCLDMNEQRRIFQQRSEDNKGALLSMEEQHALAECLQVGAMPVYSFEDFN